MRLSRWKVIFWEGRTFTQKKDWLYTPRRGIKSNLKRSYAKWIKKLYLKGRRRNVLPSVFSVVFELQLNSYPGPPRLPWSCALVSRPSPFQCHKRTGEDRVSLQVVTGGWRTVLSVRQICEAKKVTRSLTITRSSYILTNIISLFRSCALKNLGFSYRRWLEI